MSLPRPRMVDIFRFVDWLGVGETFKLDWFPIMEGWTAECARGSAWFGVKPNVTCVTPALMTQWSLLFPFIIVCKKTWKRRKSTLMCASKKNITSSDISMEQRDFRTYMIHGMKDHDLFFNVIIFNWYLCLTKWRIMAQHLPQEIPLMDDILSITIFTDFSNLSNRR